MSILIFGGTTEGRLLARELSRRGLPAWVSVATPLGGGGAVRPAGDHPSGGAAAG